MMEVGMERVCRVHEPTSNWQWREGNEMHN